MSLGSDGGRVVRLWRCFLQWRQLVAVAPKIFPKFLLLVSLIQCSIYVHAYQALVHVSTFIAFNRGCWYGVFIGMTAQKKSPYSIKISAPTKSVNWRHCMVVCCRCHWDFGEQASRRWWKEGLRKEGGIAQAWVTWPEGASAPNGMVMCRGHGVLPEMVTGASFQLFLRGGQNFLNFSMPPDYWKIGKNSTLYVVIWRYS